MSERRRLSSPGQVGVPKPVEFAAACAGIVAVPGSRGRSTTASLYPEVGRLRTTLAAKASEFEGVVMVGRNRVRIGEHRDADLMLW
jgi:hypothetical protein